MKKIKVFEHKKNCGDFIKVSLVSPPINDIDDILLEIKSENIDGIHCQGFQDWEAMLVVQGFINAIIKKHKSFENYIKRMYKQGTYLGKIPKVIPKLNIPKIK